jgi:pimeloyl-ACP methyl ester carboxylesterase/DNA-binding CsgD family transcriptional regulator
MARSHDAEIRFLPFAGHQIAYQVTGEGPPLVAPAWWLSHLELDWRDETFRDFWESLAEGFALIRYDHLGVGMSDRDVGPAELTLDGEVAALSAVLDELALERVSLFGGSSGGCTAVAFAARFPDRVERLLLYGAYMDGSLIAPREVREAIIAAVRSHWGLGSRMLADIFFGEVGRAEQADFARYQRDATTAETAAALLQLVYGSDVRAEAKVIRAPTLVAHRREDRAIPYRLGRELAAAIPDARLVPLAGDDHFPWAGDSHALVRALRPALAPLSALPRAPADESAAPLLSRREREVLALLARGLSDREVAEQLVVSHHTVHRHVANIRNKLGCRSRAAAVAEAARLGLLPD